MTKPRTKRKFKCGDWVQHNGGDPSTHAKGWIGRIVTFDQMDSTPGMPVYKVKWASYLSGSHLSEGKIFEKNLDPIG